MFNSTVNIPGSNPILNHTCQGDIKVVYQSSGSQGFKSLTEHVATGALHNSGEVSDAPKCHPGTRVAILDNVFRWATASVYLICIQWIYGPAGAGKSAILRTLAKMLEQHGLLLASFFFFRTAAGRNNTDYFIPTLAYQIARSIPSTRRHIEQAVETDPLIFSQSLEAQAQALIILPIIQAHKEGGINKQYPRIFVIDGLDECQGEEKQRMLLRVLNNLLPKLPIPFAILIASRPEPHIRDTFDLDMNKTSTRLALDNSYEPDEDIRKFYNDKFHQICNRHPLRSHLSKPWPPPSVIAILVDKASGQFIFPATVIKFVEPHRHSPSQRLDMVMGSISPGKLKPFEPLDNLYSTIFASIDPDDLDAVLIVLGVLLVPYFMIDIRSIPNLTSLTGYDTTEIQRLLFDLESLLQIEAREDDTFIRFYHASLVDFLFDQHRAGRFFVSPPMVYEQLARRCIDTLLFSEDGLTLEILEHEFQHIIHNAEPTEELIRTLKDCDVARLSQMLNGKKSILWALKIFLHQVLPAVSSSALPGADFVHAQLLTTLREFITSKVDYYFNTNLTPLLVYLMDVGSPMSWTFPNARIYYICSTQIYPISRGYCPVEIANQDQQYGFCLTLGLHLSGVTAIGRDKTWQAFIIDIVGVRAGDCYADFVIHTLNWISKFPIIPVSVDEELHIDLQDVTKYFLPTLLEKSSPRSDVQQALTENPLHPILVDKIPAYAVAIQEYLLRVNAASSQADLHLNASPAAEEMHAHLGGNTGPSQRNISPGGVSGDLAHPRQQLGSSNDMPSQSVPAVVPNDEMSSDASKKKNQETRGSRRREIKNFFRWR